MRLHPSLLSQLNRSEEVIVPPVVEEPQIVNLMDALKAGVQRIAPAAGRSSRPRGRESQVRGMPEIVLREEEWLPLIARKPSYILDRRGIVQHEALAERLRQAGFDPEQPMEIEFNGRMLALRQ